MDWIYYLRDAAILTFPSAVDDDTDIMYNGENIFIDGVKYSTNDTSVVVATAKQMFTDNPPTNGDTLELAFAIKQHAKSLIYSVVDEDTQANLAARAAVNLLGDDLSIYVEGLNWIGAVIEFSRQQVSASNEQYKQASWPQPTQAMIDLGKKY